MLNGIEIRNHWRFYSCVYREKEKEEEPYQMPETMSLRLGEG